MVKDHDWMCAGRAVFLGQERPPKRKLNSEHVEIISRNHSAENDFTAHVIAETDRRLRIERQVRQNFVAFTQNREVRVRKCRPTPVTAHEQDEFAGRFDYRQRSQKQGIDQAEDGERGPRRVEIAERDRGRR